MGTGISAAVPLVFEPHTRYGRQEKIEEESFAKGFLNNFDVEETEVWIADMPEHMIHINGDRFLGPH